MNTLTDISFRVSSADMDIIEKIALRAEKIAAKHRHPNDRRKLQEYLMDFTATHANGCPLKLQAFLDADDFNFAHDAFGIERHLNRNNGQLEDCFLPRFADLKAKRN